MFHNDKPDSPIFLELPNLIINNLYTTTNQPITLIFSSWTRDYMLYGSPIEGTYENKLFRNFCEMDCSLITIKLMVDLTGRR
jgi:hypothetical protein